MVIGLERTRCLILTARIGPSLIMLQYPNIKKKKKKNIDNTIMLTINNLY